jgi:hypothetical protein
MPAERLSMDKREELEDGVGLRRSGTNHVKGLVQFCRKWDTEKQRDGISRKNARSDKGHVNLEGSAACFSAVIFTPADPEFVDSIEVGVRDLVVLLIDNLNCITYSSCEGHPPVDETPMRQRHVGVLPRNAEEYARLLQLFRKAAEATHMNSDGETVRIDIKEAVITTEGPDVPCIDILFAAVTGHWSAYSLRLNLVYSEFLAHLENQ